MLVLSRKVGERIQIGKDVSVEVRRVAGNRVTIAIDAPRNVRILRGELQAAAEAFETEQTVGEPEGSVMPAACAIDPKAMPMLGVFAPAI
jgi:carbon storage regulator